MELHDIKNSAPILEFTSVFYICHQDLQESEQCSCAAGMWYQQTLEGPKKLSTAENTDFSAQYVSVHKQCPFCTLVKGCSWAKTESWKTVSRSKGLVSRKNCVSRSTHLSPACVLHNRASAVTAHGLILAGRFNIYRVPIKFIG